MPSDIKAKEKFTGLGLAANPVADRGYRSLPLVVHSMMARFGLSQSTAETTTLLGQAFLCPVIPGAPASSWPLIAQDAFLVSGCRSMGIQIREMHPPRASRGLAQADEFEQHFQASYKPLIAGALQHKQTVLAWKGWSAPFADHWGVIDAECSYGIGFAGRVFCEASPLESCGDGLLDTIIAPREVVLENPAVQVYVVESFCKPRVDRAALLDACCQVSLEAISEDIGRHWNIDTGSAALASWSNAYFAEECRLESDDSAAWNDHIVCAAEFAVRARQGVEAFASLLRNVGRCVAAGDLLVQSRRLFETLSELEKLPRMAENWLQGLKQCSESLEELRCTMHRFIAARPLVS